MTVHWWVKPLPEWEPKSLPGYAEAVAAIARGEKPTYPGEVAQPVTAEPKPARRVKSLAEVEAVLSTARMRLANADASIEAAEGRAAYVREHLWGGLVAFGGSGPQGAAKRARAASQAAAEREAEARRRHAYWTEKVRRLEARIQRMKGTPDV